MSKKRDYTRYSKEHNEPMETVESVEEVAETVEPVVESVEPVETKVEAPEIEENTVEEPKYVSGIVTDCLKLNVRERPHPNATILDIIPAATELIIDEEGSVNDFFKICTPAGLEGYCMKKFVTIMP